MEPMVRPLPILSEKTGKEYAISTNSDIYFYNLENSKPENETEGMMGYDINPPFRPMATG